MQSRNLLSDKLTVMEVQIETIIRHPSTLPIWEQSSNLTIAHDKCVEVKCPFTHKYAVGGEGCLVVWFGFKIYLLFYVRVLYLHVCL